MEKEELLRTRRSRPTSALSPKDLPEYDVYARPRASSKMAAASRNVPETGSGDNRVHVTPATSAESRDTERYDRRGAVKYTRLDINGSRDVFPRPIKIRNAITRQITTFSARLVSLVSRVFRCFS